MTPEDCIRHFGKHLSQYEKDEIMNLRDLIYFINIKSALKGVGRYNKGELTCLDENPDKNVSPNGIYNFGFDND